jgi:hypothetical protein
MKKIAVVLLLLVFCLTSQIADAQMDSCITKLKDAASSYDDGNYDQSIVLLKSAIQRCGLSKNDKIAALKLLTQCYIYVDELELAYRTAERITKLDPNFLPDRFKDDPKLIYLFNKFHPEPVFSIGAGVGANIMTAHLVNAFSVAYPDGQAPAAYQKKNGFQVQLQAERRIYKDLWLQAAGCYRSSSYGHQLYNVDSLTINYSEKMNYFEFPVSLKYYWGIHAIKPYVYAGADISFLSGALSTSSRPGQQDIVDRTSMRYVEQGGYHAGIGVLYRLKGFTFFAEGKYTNYPGIVNKAGTRYADQVNLYQYYYIDDDFTLSNVQFTFGMSSYLKYKNMRRK